MRSFLKTHGYAIFVTALVLALGAASRQLRHVRTQAQSASAPAPTAASTTLPSPAPTPAPVWQRPVSGGVLTPYSAAPQWSAEMDCWQVHAAVDLAAAQDEPVLAAADGAVTAVYDDMLLGLTVVLSHADGYETRCSALSSACCAPGQHVRAGDVIGAAGNSADSEALAGCHLHFALMQDGLPMKPDFE